MKKLLLFVILFFSTSILVAQNFSQPSQFNNACDDNNDGIATFWLGEISFEILANVNPQDYVVTHHETQLDATTGANPMPSPYVNVVNPQIVFARIVNVATNEVTITTYQLNVIPAPEAPTVTVTNCASVITSFPCWDLTTTIPQIVQGGVALNVSFFTTMSDAQSFTNEIVNPSCYLSQTMGPTQPPVFYRVTNSFGCFGIGVVELVTIVCENPNCPAPEQLAVTSITGSSATISWTSELNPESWIISVSANGIPFTSYVTQSNPFVLTDLMCDTNYVFSVVANCANGGNSSSEWGEFFTGACEPQAGQPTNISVCGDGNQGCFDLTLNNTLIMGTLNPSEYTLTYHLSQADADANAGVISNPTTHCASHGQPIYARLESNSNPANFQTFVFALIVDNFNPNVIPLNNMQQCDDNNDSIVTFDLTSIQAQINTGNALEYYPSLSNAQNQVAPFNNPSALNIGTQTSITQVFVREIVANECDQFYSFQLLAYANCNLAFTCNQANSLCNSLGVPFSNTIGAVGPVPLGCLGSTPNPTWFYLPISGAGTINLQITQVSNNGGQIDVDYIVHGPFTDPVTPCANTSLLAANIVSCSFSASAIEYPIIPNAQPGQYYLIMVTNYSGQPGMITISELSNSQGTIDCSGLKLNAFLDNNNNGTQDSGESNFPLGQFTYEINNNGNVHNIVSPTGVYNIYDTNAANAYDLTYTINPDYAASYAISTSSYSNVHVVIGAGMQTYNFPITVTQPYNDLAVHIVPLTAPRPGFVYQNKVVYANLGNQTIASGTVTFNHDPLVSIVNNTQSGTSPITNGFTYNFSNLLPFETREMTVSMQVPTMPTVMIGGLLTNTANIVPLAGDVVPQNNSASNTQVIIGSYDPNDKMEAHGERILHSAFTSEDYLVYTIRFENTGTASAINVRVNDVLDAQLDESTVTMISASHPYVMDRVGNNINWIFEDIQLLPSIAETSIGKGFITFKVKPRAGYAVDDVIPNTASIYFDFNPAIVTNTFNTLFVQQLGVGEFENADFVFYPNPVTDFVTVTVKNNSAIANIAVYDVLGKMVINHQPTGSASTQTLDLSSVSKGMYLLEVTTEANLKVVKKLIVD